MAIAFDNSADVGTSGSTTNFTGSYTVGSGSNRILFLYIVGDNTQIDDLTGVSYNSVSCSLAKKSVNVTQDRFCYVYYLLNPSSGAHTVNVTCTSAHFISVGGASYAGVKQGALDNTVANVSSSGVTSLMSSLVTTADNCWITLMEESYTNGNPPAASTGDTRRSFDPNNGVWGIFDSNAAITPAGSYAMTTTRPSSAVIAHIMVSFAPFVATVNSGMFEIF